MPSTTTPTRCPATNLVRIPPCRLELRFPTRTLHVERRQGAELRDGDGGAIAERLSAVDIFAPLSADETTMLAQAAVSHVFAPGETVIRAGDPGSSMFVVHKGRVRVQVSENGRPRTVATLNEGDFFGEMALFTGEPRTANVLALEETEVLEIGHAAMKRVFDTNPDLVESLSFIMAERRQGLASQTDDPPPTPALLRRHPLRHQALLRPSSRKHDNLSGSANIERSHRQQKFPCILCLFVANFRT